MCPHCGREDPHCTRRQSVLPVLFLSLGRFVRLRAWLIIAIAVAAWAFFRLSGPPMPLIGSIKIRGVKVADIDA